MNNTSDLNAICAARFNMTFPLWLAILMTITHAVVFVAGIIENICVMIVIAANKSMHTTTNYYLFSLAISDIFCVTCTPFVLASQLWSIPPFLRLCKNLSLIATVGGLGMHTSALTVALFTVERYLAICHPFQALQLSSKKKKVTLLIISIWILSLITNFPFYWDYFGHLYKIPLRFLVNIIGIVLYLIPFVTITTLCSLMVSTIKKTKKAARSTQKENSTDRTFGLLGAVVVTFLIGWFPLIAYKVVFDYLSFVPSYIKQYIYRVCCIIVCLPAVVNPILYNIVSSKFREGFKATFMKRRPIPGSKYLKKASLFGRCQGTIDITNTYI